jgi:hypothetical protein
MKFISKMAVIFMIQADNKSANTDANTKFETISLYSDTGRDLQETLEELFAIALNNH